MMQHNAAEYEAMALECIEKMEGMWATEHISNQIALAQVYATLCAAAPMDDDEDEDEDDGF